MTTILECFNSVGFSYTKHTGEVGIEIETESKDAYALPRMKFWSTKQDGSLRDFGIEYILRAPVNRGMELKAALREFEDKTRGFNLIPDSISTSVHAHVNFLNDTWLTLANYMTAYYLHEGLLIRYSGPDRLSNLFCLPITDAEGELQSALGILQSLNNRRYKSLGVSVDSNKYAALNLANLTKLGTLEVRSFRGSININEIEKWILILMKIKDFAKQDGMTPQKILDMYKRYRGELVDIIFGDLARELNYPDKMKLIEGKKNLYYAAKLATVSPKWDHTWGMPKPKKVYREHYKNDLEKLAQDKFQMKYDELNFAYQLIIDELYEQGLNGARLVFFEGEQE